MVSWRNRFFRFITNGLIVFLVAGCASTARDLSSTEAPAAEMGEENLKTPTPVLPSATQEAPVESEPQYCQEGEYEDHPYYTIVNPEVQVEMVWKASFIPWWVRSTQDGKLLGITQKGDTIFELMPDGSREVYFRCPGVKIESFTVASDGSIWFGSGEEHRLYRRNLDGTVEIIKKGIDRLNLEAGPDGSVYAMFHGLSKFEQDGAHTEITKMVSGRKFTVGPNGDVVANTGGDIVRISGTGEIMVLAEDYGPEAWPRYSPEGDLYAIQFTGIDRIDPGTGEIDEIGWLKGHNKAGEGFFTQDGRLIIYHPITQVFEVDFEEQQINLIHAIQGNSWAMAVDPGEIVYIAHGNDQPAGETIIYRVVDSMTLEAALTVPYGFERGMAFDSQGLGYIAISDPQKGRAILQFDPGSGVFELYREPICSPRAITVHPETDRPWWDECEQFHSYDDSGNLITLQGLPGGTSHTLAITPEGEFYATIFFERDGPNLPFEHRMYRLRESDSTWEEIADLTQDNPEITLSTLVACPDGRIYTVESLAGSVLPSNRCSMNAVRRLEPDGSFTLLGFDFSFDPLAADCDRSTGKIIFTSGIGIFGLTPP